MGAHLHGGARTDTLVDLPSTAPPANIFKDVFAQLSALEYAGPQVGSGAMLLRHATACMALRYAPNRASSTRLCVL
jgi:hypothetical protein